MLGRRAKSQRAIPHAEFLSFEPLQTLLRVEGGVGRRRRCAARRSSPGGAVFAHDIVCSSGAASPGITNAMGCRADRRSDPTPNDSPSEAKGPDASVACLGLGRASVRGKRGFWAAHLCRITNSTRSQSGRRRAPAPSIISLQSWRAADKEPESMPRNRSPIGSLSRAADCTSRLSGLPGRIGGAARGETEPHACVTAGTAAAAAFGTEIGTAGARGEVAAETGGDALEAAGAQVSAGAGPPAGRT